MQIAGWVLVAAFTVPLAVPLAPQTSRASRPKTFVIRTLEAHSGEPEARVALNVFLGVEKRKPLPLAQEDEQARAGRYPVYFTTAGGDATVPIIPADSLILSLIVGTDIPCEAHAPDDPNLHFSLKEILERGVVADNVCGKARATSVPGVLIIFVKHRPWWRMGEIRPPSPPGAKATRVASEG